jgi:hypothetical protein
MNTFLEQPLHGAHMRIVGSKTRAERPQPRGRIQGGTLARPELAGVENSRFVMCKSSHTINSLHS